MDYKDFIRELRLSDLLSTPLNSDMKKLIDIKDKGYFYKESYSEVVHFEYMGRFLFSFTFSEMDYDIQLRKYKNIFDKIISILEKRDIFGFGDYYKLRVLDDFVVEFIEKYLIESKYNVMRKMNYGYNDYK